MLLRIIDFRNSAQCRHSSLWPHTEQSWVVFKSGATTNLKTVSYLANYQTWITTGIWPCINQHVLFSSNKISFPEVAILWKQSLLVVKHYRRIWGRACFHPSHHYIIQFYIMHNAHACWSEHLQSLNYITCLVFYCIAASLLKLYLKFNVNF